MVIAITGGFCTGKSEVARIFRKFGAKIIDLDKLAHLTLKPRTESFKKIVRAFGRDILTNGRINRLLLAKKVFGNRKKLNKLNSIIHPVVIKEMNDLIKKFHKECPVIIAEVPLLFEAGLNDYFDYVIVVNAGKKTQIKRAAAKTNLSKTDILKRIKSQWPIERKIKLADSTIDNNGSIGNTRRQAKNIFENLKKELFM
ncbi:MAG: dephospho-CoA kinase [Candidatus Omnitrophica bacterium]|nr:dephospho-CoA kinase [Candidatus Omnitrophota bacterium]MDD5351894.1 dephospho-CoA kinase [Candidatus Omnitrophota bacterium]MDD5550720.1 dephospho-CoA kinase [Candidatus Omnitrophota bacterium]